MDLKFILEAILFHSQKPLSLRELRDVLNATAEQAEDPAASAAAAHFKKLKEEVIAAALAELETEIAAANRSFRLTCVAGAWQFVSQPEFSPWLKTLVGAKNRPPRLTQPALETLAIIAYRQPITRAEMEQVRGVAVDGVVATLQERGLIAQVGRAEVIGRPITYGTTPLFLEYFGMRDLDELPAADELRRIVVEKPPSLLTVDSAPESAAAAAPPETPAPAPAADAAPAGANSTPNSDS